jgi:hypothetical protein
VVTGSIERAIQVSGVGCIEADPEQDEANILIVGFCLRSSKPAQCPVDAKPNRFWMPIPKLSMLRLERLMTERGCGICFAVHALDS